MRQLPAPMAPQDEPIGGKGHGARTEADRPQLSVADIRTMRRAILGRWPIREEKRQDIIDSLTMIATNPGFCGVRESVQAAKALIDADKVNLEDEKRRVRQPDMIEVQGRLKVCFASMTDEELDRFIEAGDQS